LHATTKHAQTAKFPAITHVVRKGRGSGSKVSRAEKLSRRAVITGRCTSISDARSAFRDAATGL